MTLYETVLYYDCMSEENREKMERVCLETGSVLKIIRPEEYRVPLGFLCYGNDDQIGEYIISGDPAASLERPMLLLAGFTEPRLRLFLEKMKSQGVPPVALKAVLTEYNATWDSLALYDELKKEDEYYH